MNGRMDGGNETHSDESMDAFEADVRRTFRRRFETLDPIAARIPLQGAPGPLVTAVRRAGNDRARVGHSRHVGVALGAAAVLLAIVLAPLALHDAMNVPAASTPPVATATAATTQWKTPVIPESAGRIISVDGNARGWLAVLDADGVRQVWYSKNGSAWARAPKAEEVLRLAGVTQVVATPNGFLVVEDQGDAGTRFWWSADADTWHEFQPPTHPVVRVLWGKGGFVVLGGSDAWHSADLVNWSKPTSLGSAVVLTGNAGTSRGYMVSVDGGGVSPSSLAWSPDGVNWTQRGLTADDVLIGSAVGRDAMIGIGYSRTDQTRLVWRSTDGATWTRSVAMRPLAFSGLTSDGVDMFGVSGGQLFRSTNGIDWAEIVDAASVLPVLSGPAAAYGGNLAVVGPSGEGLWILPRHVLDATRPFTAPAPGPTATSSGSNAPEQTPASTPTPSLPAANGIPPRDAWQSLSAFATIPDSSSFQTVAGAKGIVSVTRQSAGSPGFTLYYSHDGKSFSKADTSDATFNRASIKLYATPFGFSGIGMSNIGEDGTGGRATIWHSADGSVWQPANVDTSADWVPRAVASSPNGLLAVGSRLRGPLEAFAFTSPDGVTWQRLALDPTTFRDADLMSVAWSGKTGWVIAGGGPMIGGTVWQSADLASWQSTRLKLQPGVGTGQLALFGGRDGVVAETWTTPVEPTGGHAGPAQWSSRDGQTWSDPALLDMPVAYASNGSLIVRSNGGQIQESYDGTTWYTLPASVTSDFWLDSVGPDGIFVLVHPFETTVYLKSAP